MAVMVLTDDSFPAISRRQCGTKISLAAGKRLKIETSPQGEELLDVQVPSGESWTVNLSVYVVVESV